MSRSLVRLRYYGNRVAVVLMATVVLGQVGSVHAERTDKASRPAEMESDAWLTLPIRVVDSAGEPVVAADVRLFALRSSQGHGTWQAKKHGDRSAPTAVTDLNGRAELPYPAFTDPDEHVATLAVTLNVDHPRHAYKGDVHIDVPLPTEQPYEVRLDPAMPVTVRPTIDGQPTPLANVYAQWSGGRAWSKHTRLERRDGLLVLPAQRVGKGTVRLVRIKDDIATHFSPVLEFEVEQGSPCHVDAVLEPAVELTGRLEDSVPRPITAGRVKAWSLLTEDHHLSLHWMTWAPVAADGTFVITGWPSDATAQVIALCDGYHAASGAAPPEVKNPRDPKTDPFLRAQVFRPPFDQPAVIDMLPMARVQVTATDLDDQPLEGVKVGSCPNVQWWNSGSQIYCNDLLHSEDLVRKRDYFDSLAPVFMRPFEVTTDEAGRATLELPTNRGSLKLYAGNDDYELPVILGERGVAVALTAEETTGVSLRLQPKGTDQLGDWDKLAGVVFGCSTREGRRICALPGVKAKMNEFRDRIRQADDPRDPAILADAYQTVAEAFEKANDPDEADRWRARAEEQAKLAADRD